MLELRNISLVMNEGQERVTVLDKINLTLEDHRFYVITGPNGGGKSSLAKLIMGSINLLRVKYSWMGKILLI